MIIYFEDGYMQMPPDPEIRQPGYHTVYAAAGYFACEKKLDAILAENKRFTVVYTNSVAALQNKYCYDDYAGYMLILRDKHGKWHHVDYFTQRELRPAHNIFHLYKSGEFGKPGEREVVVNMCQNCFEVKMPLNRLSANLSICPDCEKALTVEAFNIDLDKFFMEDEE